MGLRDGHHDRQAKPAAFVRPRLLDIATEGLEGVGREVRIQPRPLIDDADLHCLRIKAQYDADKTRARMPFHIFEQRHHGLLDPRRIDLANARFQLRLDCEARAFQAGLEQPHDRADLFG